MPSTQTALPSPLSHRRHATGAVVLCGLTALVAGCHRYPAPPQFPQDDPALEGTLDLRPKGMEDTAPQPIRVLAGDVVSVRTISADEAVYEDLVVDELGNLHLPLIGNVKVAGLTLSEAEKLIEKALRKYDAVVRVSIQVTDATGHRATVIGAVSAAGTYTVVPGMRVAELLAKAGGPNMGGDFNNYNVADLSSARLVREGQMLPVSVELAMEGHPRHNVRVRAGDHLYVPAIRGDTITVIGEAAEPHVLIYRPQIRLTQVLAMAGDIPITGRKRDVRIIRGDMTKPTIYKVSHRAIGRGEAVDIQMAPGDIVYVGRRSLAEMAEVLSALGPLISTPLSVGLSVGLTNALTEPVGAAPAAAP